MSKELIEKLREAAILATSECAWLMTEAADALEAKAATVGEREVFEAFWKAGFVTDTTKELALLSFQAGAAYQRAQQPQSAEAVAFYWQDVGYKNPNRHGPYFGWPTEAALRNVDGGAIPVPLYTTPQPSAGVVMPESVGVLILGGLFHGGSGPELGDIDIEPNMRVLERIQMELVTSSDDVHLELFARLNGKEVV